MRIRRGIVSINGGQVTGMANVEFQDAHEFDRSNADNQYSGIPIEMIRKGSGTVEWLSGGSATGYTTASMVVTFYEVSQTSGVESITTKTATFTNVTLNRGYNIPAEGAGRVKCSFDYSTCTIA